MLRLPFSGGRLSLHKGFLSATAAKLFPSFSGSNKLHKGRYSAPVCGFCPRIPVHVALAADSFVVGLRSASPSWPAAWGGGAIEESFVVQVRGTDCHSGERVCCYRAPSSLPKEDDADGRSGDGGMSST